MKLLIVDDHPRIRETIKLLVIDLADEILEAADGTEAVTASTIHQPDWILMDIEMKEMDGIEATRQIKSIFPEAHILVLTSFDDDFMRAAALAAGASGFALKDNLTEVVRFLREFPPCPPPLAASLDQNSSRSSVREQAEQALGCGFVEDPAANSGSASQEEPRDLFADDGLARTVPPSQELCDLGAPDVWAASCRDCAAHALKKLSRLESQSGSIRQAVLSIRRSLEPSLWLDETQLDPTKGRRAFGEWHQAVRTLSHLPAELPEKQAWNKEAQSAIKEAIEDLIQGAVLLIAQTVQSASRALITASARQREQAEEELSKAQLEIARADTKLAKTQFDLAVLDYGKAWLHASFAASLGGAAKG